MKHLKVDVNDCIHVEVTLGLSEHGEEGMRYTTRHVTDYLHELNQERMNTKAPAMTFKVFSGYAPYLDSMGNRVIENVALLHVDYNPDGQAQERYDTFIWYLQRLMERLKQTVAYAHFTAVADSGHKMLVYTLEEKEKGPAN